MSRSLVGSSSTSTLAGRANSRASSSRLRSPPDSILTGDSRALRWKQEIAEVADDVPSPAADLDPVGGGVHGGRNAHLRVELLAQLVEVGDLQVGAEPDRRPSPAATWPRISLQQRGLAGAIRADQAETVAAHDPERQARDDGAPAVALGDVLQLRDELAGAFARVEAQLDVAQALAPRGALLAQLLQPLHAPFVAGAAGLDALADPDLLLRPELVEAAVGDCLGRELLVLAPLVGGVSSPGRSAAGRDRARRCASRRCRGRRDRA